jgi:hypothetical protein
MVIHLLLIFLLPFGADGNQFPTKSIQQATIEDIIEGNQIYIQQQPAKLKDRARQGQIITTAKARAEIEFNNQSIVRMGNNSKLVVGSCVNLEQGSVLVSGKMSTCTKSITAAVRGTTYYLEIDPDQTDNPVTTISVLEGEIEVSDTNTPNQPPIRLGAGQKLRSIRGKLQERLENMTQSELEQIIKTKIMAGYRRPLSTRAQIARVLRRKFPRSPLLRRL